MTLKSTWSIISDDENSRQSFLSDCDSEFDLSPPPRYPAEKRSSSTLKNLSLSQNEPPMTRARAKAMQKPIAMPPHGLKPQRQSIVRRSVDSFAGMATSLKDSLNSSSILFPKQESSDDRSEVHKPLHSPPDGVNTLTDWLESCSLDEGQFSRNCLWPSRETNSHYMRPVTSTFSSPTAGPPGFGSNPFSMLQPSPLFVQSSTTTATTLFGQQQAQLWSRFRFAASTIRNSSWMGPLDSTVASHSPSNLFQSTCQSNTTFAFSDPSTDMRSFASPSQRVPSSFMSATSSSFQTSSPLLRQRQTTSEIDSEPSPTITPTRIEKMHSQPSRSKLVFSLAIFAVGLLLGYLLTTTFPPGRLLHWFFQLADLCTQMTLQSFHVLCAQLQRVIKYFSSSP